MTGAHAKLISGSPYKADLIAAPREGNLDAFRKLMGELTNHLREHRRWTRTPHPAPLAGPGGPRWALKGRKDQLKALDKALGPSRG